MTAPAALHPWYAGGLAFSCARCGNCCSGAPGYVWLTIDEAARMAAELRLELDAFTRTYTRRVGARLSLLEKKGGDCIFLIRTPDGLTRCQIHAVRPVQCRTWPFWKSNLNSQRAWERAGRGCPGINQGGPHQISLIQAQLAENGDLPL